MKVVNHSIKSFVVKSGMATLLVGLVLATQNAVFAGDKLSPAPDFTLASKSDGNVRLQEQRGSVVLINFWASWCGPCREELPLLEALQQDYADLGFTILAVNVDKTPDKAEVLLSDIPVTFRVLFDHDAVVSKLYDVSAMPTTVIVDRDGNQRLLHKGYKSGDVAKYEHIIKTLLRE
jgi:thiol-disulfide isomerase/thioredoxin